MHTKHSKVYNFETNQRIVDHEIAHAFIFLFFIFVHNKGINIHMTYNNNKQSEIITL